MTKKHLLLLLAAFCSGLCAGVMFSYQIAVMPGFSVLSDAAFIEAFQTNNTAIVNPWFMGLAFLGSVVALAGATIVWRQQPRVFKRLLIALALYMVGVIGVTGAGNVPLNNKIAAFDLEQSTAQEQASIRADFEAPWNRLHLIRTIVSMGVFGIALSALLIADNKEKS